MLPGSQPVARMSPVTLQTRGFQLLVTMTQTRVGVDDLPELTTANFIGIVVAITGNVLISLALNLQKLAHKRIETRTSARQKPSQQHGGSPNGRCGQRLRGSEGPGLDENDEDHLQCPPEENGHNNSIAESQSLSSFPKTSPSISDYGAVLIEQRNFLGRSPSTPQKNVLLSRWVPSGGDDDANDGIPSQDISTLAVDIVSEESALNHQGSVRKLSSERVDVAGEGKETEYLRSKLWYVLFPISNF